MILATASRIAAVALSGAALLALTFAASGAPAVAAVGLAAFQDDEPGYLGVTLGDEGLRIDAVTAGSAAAGAGLQPGDVIVWIAGKDVETYDQLVDVLKHNPPGSNVGLVYLRGEETRKMKITLGSRSKPGLERVQEDDAEHDHAEVLEHEEALRRVLDDFVEAPKADEPGFLGINLGEGEGVDVGSVIDGTPAAKAGLRAGDRIVRIDEIPVGNLEELRRVLLARPPGTKVQLQVQRGDKLLRLSARLGRQDGGEVPAPPAEEEELRRRIELELRSALADVPRADDAPGGPGFLGVYLDETKDGAVVSSLVPGSAAERARLQPGDRILALGGREIDSAAALREAIEACAAGTRVELVLVRGDRKVRVELALGARAEPASAPLAPERQRDLERADVARQRAMAERERAMQERQRAVETEREVRQERERGRERERAAERERVREDLSRGAEGSQRAEFERVLRELQDRGTEMSRRWAGTYDERMRDLGRDLREQSRVLDEAFRNVRERTDRELLDESTRARIRAELQDWAKDRTRLLEENAGRIRGLEKERLQRLDGFLRGLRESGGAEAQKRVREMRQRVGEIEDGFGRILREEVAPQGRAALQEMHETMGALRAEVEGLRHELEALRQALRGLRSQGR